jgi:hypothetical protein
MCLRNDGGMATRRVYDVHTGRLIGDILSREGDYRQAFPEDITGALRLNGGWSEDDLESWGTELPMVVLDSLQADLEMARAEMGTKAVAEQAAS